MRQAPLRHKESDDTRGGGSTGRRRARVGATVGAFVLLASVVGCASGGSAGGAGGAAAPSGAKCNYGCMIPGTRVASALGISAIDTIPELNPRATLRATVDNAIRQHVLQNNWTTNNNCLRKFGGPDVYVVVFHRYCDPSMGSDSDPRMVVGFSGTGRVLGEVSWIGPPTVALLIPERRY